MTTNGAFLANRVRAVELLFELLVYLLAELYGVEGLVLSEALDEGDFFFVYGYDEVVLPVGEHARKYLGD